MGMVFRRATADDHAELVRITTEGRAYLASQGIDQWAGGNPTPEQLAQDIQNGWSHVVADDATGEVLGVAAVCDAGEEDYDHVIDGAWLTGSANVPQNGEVTYLVVHRVAVSATAKRRGVASFLFSETMRLARERGFASVRVDTHRGNIPMQATLAKCGFTRCCEVVIANPYEPTKERVGYEIVL